MTYSVTSSSKPSGGMEYHVLWKGNFSPAAVCSDYRDAQRICDALNNVDATASRIALKWHCTKDRMPDDGIEVLCYISASDDIRIAHHDDGKWWDNDCLFIRSEITHWCEPEPPNLTA